MSAIGPGDWVECVDASPGVWSGLPSLTLGAIYQVREILLDGIGLALVGVKPPLDARGYFVERFRPIYRPKADLIESLKTPAKREGVPA